MNDIDEQLRRERIINTLAPYYDNHTYLLAAAQKVEEWIANGSKQPTLRKKKS